MRVSELCGLKWKDIQTDGIHVARINMTIKDWQEDGYINVETLPKTISGKIQVYYKKNESPFTDDSPDLIVSSVSGNIETVPFD